MQRSGDSGKPGICRASPGSQLPHPEGDGRTRGGGGGGGEGVKERREDGLPRAPPTASTRRGHWGRWSYWCPVRTPPPSSSQPDCL